MRKKLSWLLSSAAVLALAVGINAKENPRALAKENPQVLAKKSENPEKATIAKKKKLPEVKWLTDFAKARETAKKKKRPILANFSGSDWCYWCKKLDKEVLSQKPFKYFARTNLVLFSADFPRSKKQADKVKLQNETLAKKYGVRGFPTVLLMDAEGKVLAQTGYRKGGPDVYVKHVRKLFEEAKKREKKLALKIEPAPEKKKAEK